MTLFFAHIELGYSRIMVRNCISNGGPGVDVNMLKLSLGLQRLTDVDVINFLAVHIEEIGILFEFRNVGGIIEVTEIGQGLEVLDW